MGVGDDVGEAVLELSSEQPLERTSKEGEQGQACAQTCPPKGAWGFWGAGLKPRDSLLWSEQEREAGPGTVNLMGQLDWAVVPTCCPGNIL